MDNEWMAEGNCRTEAPSMFFPSDGVGVEVARRICATCPVKEPCLEFAIETNQKYGIWGGLTDKERASLKRRRARARRAS